MPRKCLNLPDRFCFVCGKFTNKEQQRNILMISRRCMRYILNAHLVINEIPGHIIKYVRNAV